MFRPKSLLQKASSSKVLLFVLGVQAALIIVRTANLYATGFQTADEVNYIFDTIVNAPYGGRYFFDYQLIFLFRLFSINTISQFFVLFPFYVAAWSFSFIILASKTLELLTRNSRARDLTIFTLPFAISYSILSLGIFSEGPGLTMCMLGIYAWVRYSKVQPRWYLAAISSAAFVAAAYSREPYVIFPVIGAAAWVALAIARKAAPHHAVTFLAIAALILAAPAGTFYGASGAVSAVPESVQTYTSVVTSTTSYSTSSFTTSSLVKVTTVQTLVVNGTTTTSTGTSLVKVTTVQTLVVNGTTTTSTITAPKTTTYVTSTISSIVEAAPVFNGFFTGWAQVVSNTLILFFIGMIFGWGPVLFVVGIIAFLFFFKIKPRRNVPWLQLFIVVLSLATFFGSVFVFYYEFHFYLTQGFSNLIRLTNTTIPAYLLLAPILYEKLSGRGTKIVAGALVVMTIASAGFYVTALQTNFQLPYNVLDFGHVNSPLQAREYFLQNSATASQTVVFLSWNWEGAQLYLRGMNGLVLYPTINTTYNELVSNYTEDTFLNLRPSDFYILSEIPLSNWNPHIALQANVQRVMDYQSPFLYKTFGALYDLNTAVVGPTPYRIDSVQTVFQTPTGFLLEVHASWQD